MVAKYKRKTERQSWLFESMEQTMRAVINGSMGYKLAVDQFQVAYATFERYVRKKREDHDYAVIFDLTIKELCILAFQLAERNKLSSSIQNKTAGFDWMRGFLTRHPVLSLRKPKATFAARAMGFNEVAVQKFYDFLANMVDTHHLAADRIYNCDETGNNTKKVPPLNLKLPSSPHAKRAKKATPPHSLSSESDEPVEEDKCLYGHDYSEKGWIRCSSCTKWAHNSCAGREKRTKKLSTFAFFVKINS
ncbi:hypothetical protein ILUMI_24309 [Ignelater luminosus]|uniref:Uncharacterized protein n=1 Tax=Ignelater luminosus TaxID=2038154 RepID=A0A8K0C7A8_IGNLU|nr:hypothetical protein ILUMI_24309 [Ignelater luminosus]